MRIDVPRGRMGVRSRRTAAVLAAVTLAGAGWSATAQAQDTGFLPLPTDLDLGKLPSAPGLTEGIPNVANLWTFHLTDQPGHWFDSGVNLFGTKSLGVATAGTAKVRFVSDPKLTDSNHTATSLIWPTGAKNMPFDQDKAWKNGEHSVDLKTPGLYAFVCKMHPFMLAAVIKDDPTTPGLDFGKSATYAGGRVMATDSDLYMRIIKSFFVITNPGNWQDFSAKNTTHTWDPNYAPAPITAYDSRGHQKLIPNLDVFMQKRFKEPVTLPPLFKPSTPGVGEVWLNTQYEKTAGKSKPGTVTALDATSFDVTKKFGLPEINMNNPHNMWPNRAGNLIFTTQWFSHFLTVFDRNTGKLVRNVDVGDAPAHVMTRTDTDQIHVGLNGEDSVVELAPDATKIDRRIPVSMPGEKQAQPHAHGMSADGKIMVTPNSNTDDTTQIDIPSGKIVRKPLTGHLPIAAWVHPNGLSYYSSSFLEGTVSCVSTTDKPACADGGKVVAQTKIDLMGNYNQDTGVISGPMGGLPIQTPVSPDGKFVIQANTLTATVTIIDTKTNNLVKALACDAGCHGGNFGAKKGGGYYVYISNKFSDTMEVVDLDPDGDGDAKDAKVVGRVLTDAGAGTKMDDTVSGLAGQGGQGVLPLPNVNNGWVQNLPASEKVGLTKEQLNPLGTPQKVCGRRVTITASSKGMKRVTAVRMNGRKLKTFRKAGKTTAVLDLTKMTGGRATVKVTGKTAKGKTVTRVRKISACVTRR